MQSFIKNINIPRQLNGPIAVKRSQNFCVFVSGIDVSCFDEELLDEDGRVLEIVTEQTEQYFVTENAVEKIDDSVLHRENCYVIKWKYLVNSTGRFAASKPTNSKSTPSGRSKVAYFSWIGSDSASGQKGASALIASNMETGKETSLQQFDTRVHITRLLLGDCHLL